MYLIGTWVVMCDLIRTFDIFRIADDIDENLVCSYSHIKRNIACKSIHYVSGESYICLNIRIFYTLFLV